MAQYYKYHFIVANYELFDFKELFDIRESKSYKWFNSQHLTYKKGDVVYVYYSNLPDGTSRIFLRAEVDKVDNEAIYLIKVTGIPNGYMNKYTAMDLRNNYDVTCFRGASYLKVDSNDKHKMLVEELEKIMVISVDDTRKYKDLPYRLNELASIYLNLKCFVDSSHKTFKRENNLYYYEGHHFIPQHTSGIEGINLIIYDDNNLISLCPMCHREIHNASLNRRKELITFIYNSRDGEFKKKLKNVIGINDDKIVIEWIFRLYLNKAELLSYEEGQ